MVKGRGEGRRKAVWAAAGKNQRASAAARKRKEAMMGKVHGVVSHGHGMKDSVGREIVKVVLEVKYELLR